MESRIIESIIYETDVKAQSAQTFLFDTLVGGHTKPSLFSETGYGSVCSNSPESECHFEQIQFKKSAAEFGMARREERERYIVEVPPESWMGRRMSMLFCINARSKERRELEARESWLGKKLRRKSFFPEFPA